jgi:hypothetical protein
MLELKKHLSPISDKAAVGQHAQSAASASVALEIFAVDFDPQSHEESMNRLTHKNLLIA